MNWSVPHNDNKNQLALLGGASLAKRSLAYEPAPMGTCSVGKPGARRSLVLLPLRGIAQCRDSLSWRSSAAGATQSSATVARGSAERHSRRCGYGARESREKNLVSALPARLCLRSGRDPLLHRAHYSELSDIVRSHSTAQPSRPSRPRLSPLRSKSVRRGSSRGERGLSIERSFPRATVWGCFILHLEWRVGNGEAG